MTGDREELEATQARQDAALGEAWPENASETYNRVRSEEFWKNLKRAEEKHKDE